MYELQGNNQERIIAFLTTNVIKDTIVGECKRIGPSDNNQMTGTGPGGNIIAYCK